MAQHSIQAVVLAAGKSSRFNTGNSKLLEKICGQEMILYPINVLQDLEIPIIAVLGYHASEVKEVLAAQHQTISYAHQEEQKGTGHALFSSQQLWHAEHILVINGDMPLITQDIIQQLIQKHIQSESSVSFVIAHNEDPSLTGYGRVIKEGQHVHIVEARNFQGNAHEHCCVNAGIYIFKRTFLEKYSTSLNPNEETHEYYLTDLINIASQHGNKIETISAYFDKIRGINTLKELWTAEQIKRSELITNWMHQGVRFYAAQAVHVDLDISIGHGTYIGYGVHISKGTRIGSNCIIEAFTILNNAVIDNNVTIRSHSVIDNSTIASGSQIGPFAHIHTQSTLNEKIVVGNFVEIKQSSLDKNTKVKHLTYLGNAIIGNNVNIGAGTITCNHNGISKNSTTIKNNAYIGSNNTIIAPITIGEHAFTAAGSVITDDVPDNALAIARAHQINKEEYAKKLRQQKQELYTNTETESKSEMLFTGALKTQTDSLENL